MRRSSAFAKSYSALNRAALQKTHAPDCHPERSEGSRNRSLDHRSSFKGAISFCQISWLHRDEQAAADRRSSGTAIENRGCYFIKSTERLRLISRVILRCKCAGIPVTRRGRILPLSVTNFFRRSGFL